MRRRGEGMLAVCQKRRGRDGSVVERGNSLVRPVLAQSGSLYTKIPFSDNFLLGIARRILFFRARLFPSYPVPASSLTVRRIPSWSAPGPSSVRGLLCACMHAYLSTSSAFNLNYHNTQSQLSFLRRLCHPSSPLVSLAIPRS